MTKFHPLGIAILFCASKDDEGVITHFGVQGVFDRKGEHMTKADVVAEAKAGTEFTPMWTDAQGKKHLGLKCHVSGDHIAADPNDKICDNLAELPECELTSFYTA